MQDRTKWLALANTRRGVWLRTSRQSLRSLAPPAASLKTTMNRRHSGARYNKESGAVASKQAVRSFVWGLSVSVCHDSPDIPPQTRASPQQKMGHVERHFDESTPKIPLEARHNQFQWLWRIFFAHDLSTECNMSRIHGSRNQGGGRAPSLISSILGTFATFFFPQNEETPL